MTRNVRRGRASAQPGLLPHQTLTYAIGDIHGCSNKLRDLLAQCEADADGRPATLIFLGDYIDRGPDSRNVIELLMDLQQARPDQAICLMGNHEDMLLAAADHSAWEDRWLCNGGTQTLGSYGVSDPRDLPKAQVDWLRRLPKFHDDGRRLFVHAGIHPNRALDLQDETDLLWIKEPFLSSNKDFGRLIVHGHSPTSDRRPEIRSNRLNIDTGAVFGGPLAAAVFNVLNRDPQGFLFAA
ncbi:metallophosphoesterase family protein [Tardiphaga alba]|uniref:metallophosphoesterase family protein n=1 Tax=Tardiphaga alba TaxID=340268 RepID=UPI002012F67D|nr:metallophosphoesterase family protein [Tardiphaga alba]